MSDEAATDPVLPPRIDRRLAIKWILAAGAGALLVDKLPFAAGSPEPVPTGYGLDALLTHPNKPGDFWPLSLSDAERRAAAALCDMVIPAEGQWPSASGVGVHDFIDEWISAPYPSQAGDRKVVVEGLGWLDTASRKRFGSEFAAATPSQRLALCEEMAPEAPAGSELELAARFFRRFRNLTSAGYFSTPVGMKDLGYVGNLPLARFDGPPADLVEKLGLSDEVKW